MVKVDFGCLYKRRSLLASTMGNDIVLNRNSCENVRVISKIKGYAAGYSYNRGYVSLILC